MFSLLAYSNGDGELCACVLMGGEVLDGPAAGGFRMTFLLEDACLTGRNGDDVFGVVELMEGIGA